MARFVGGREAKLGVACRPATEPTAEYAAVVSTFSLCQATASLSHCSVSVVSPPVGAAARPCWTASSRRRMGGRELGRWRQAGHLEHRACAAATDVGLGLHAVAMIALIASMHTMMHTNSNIA